MIYGKTNSVRVYSEGEYAVLEQVGNGKKVRVHVSQVEEFCRKLQAAADNAQRPSSSDYR